VSLTQLTAAPQTPQTPQWRRLSPRMLLVHPVIEVGKALPAILGAFLAGHSSGHDDSGSRWSLAIAGVVATLSLLRWVTTRYRITPEQIQLRHGLLRRRTLAAPVSRVRTVDVTSHLLHRALGLARVVIGTGTSDRKGRDRLVLDGLSAGAAAGLRAELLHRAPAVEPDTTLQPTQPETQLAVLDPRWLRYAPFTLTGAVTGLALLGVGWRVVTEGHVDVNRIGPYRAAADRLGQWPLGVDIAVVAVAVVLFVAVASTLGYLLSFWNFRLTRHVGGTLHVSRGLLTSRATSIERRRLLGAELSEPLLLRAAGGARCLAIATGLRVGRGAERGGEILLPPAPRAEAARVAGVVLGRADPFVAAVQEHPAGALRRRVGRAVGVLLLMTIGLGLVAWAAGWSAWLLLVPAILLAPTVALGIDRYRSLGHALVEGHLVTRFGSLVRRRSALGVDGIIGWNLRSSWFQRRLGLATLTATTAAGKQRYPVQDVAAQEAVRFADECVPGLLTQFLA
jgi:putative membrane protein